MGATGAHYETRCQCSKPHITTRTNTYPQPESLHSWPCGASSTKYFFLGKNVIRVYAVSKPGLTELSWCTSCRTHRTSFTQISHSRHRHNRNQVVAHGNEIIGSQTIRIAFALLAFLDIGCFVRFAEKSLGNRVMSLHLQKSEIFAFHPCPNSWERVVFAEFEASLTSKSRTFPCVFAVAGFRTNSLRFGYVENPLAVSIAPILNEYLRECRKFGRYTSLVVFSRPGPVLSIDTYEKMFWRLLIELVGQDKHRWPEDIPRQLDSPLWEFCFAGEAIFVVCNTPAHVLRQSRRASSFMVTFQPRWVFEGILGTTEAAKRSTSKVRDILRHYDMIDPSPHLGLYGDDLNREYRQYFLRENNGEVKCPYSVISNHLASERTA